MFLKTTKFGMQQKAHIFISGLPNPNSFHILTRDTESNHLKQKAKNWIFLTKTLLLTKNNDVWDFV